MEHDGADGPCITEKEVHRKRVKLYSKWLCFLTSVADIDDEGNLSRHRIFVPQPTTRMVKSDFAPETESWRTAKVLTRLLNDLIPDDVWTRLTIFDLAADSGGASLPALHSTEEVLDRIIDSRIEETLPWMAARDQPTGIALLRTTGQFRGMTAAVAVCLNPSDKLTIQMNTDDSISRSKCVDIIADASAEVFQYLSNLDGWTHAMPAEYPSTAAEAMRGAALKGLMHFILEAECRYKEFSALDDFAERYFNCTDKIRFAEEFARGPPPTRIKVRPDGLRSLWKLLRRKTPTAAAKIVHKYCKAIEQRWISTRRETPWAHIQKTAASFFSAREKLRKAGVKKLKAKDVANIIYRAKKNEQKARAGGRDEAPGGAEADADMDMPLLDEMERLLEEEKEKDKAKPKKATKMKKMMKKKMKKQVLKAKPKAKLAPETRAKKEAEKRWGPQPKQLDRIKRAKHKVNLKKLIEKEKQKDRDEARAEAKRKKEAPEKSESGSESDEDDDDDDDGKKKDQASNAAAGSAGPQPDADARAKVIGESGDGIGVASVLVVKLGLRDSSGKLGSATWCPLFFTEGKTGRFSGIEFFEESGAGGLSLVYTFGDDGRMAGNRFDIWCRHADQNPFAFAGEGLYSAFGYVGIAVNGDDNANANEDAPMLDPDPVSDPALAFAQAERFLLCPSTNKDRNTRSLLQSQMRARLSAAEDIYGDFYVGAERNRLFARIKPNCKEALLFRHVLRQTLQPAASSSSTVPIEMHAVFPCQSTGKKTKQAGNRPTAAIQLFLEAWICRVRLILAYWTDDDLGATPEHIRKVDELYASHMAPITRQMQKPSQSGRNDEINLEWNLREELYSHLYIPPDGADDLAGAGVPTRIGKKAAELEAKQKAEAKTKPKAKTARKAKAKTARKAKAKTARKAKAKTAPKKAKSGKLPLHAEENDLEFSDAEDRENEEGVSGVGGSSSKKDGPAPPEAGQGLDPEILAEDGYASDPEMEGREALEDDEDDDEYELEAPDPVVFCRVDLDLNSFEGYDKRYGLPMIDQLWGVRAKKADMWHIQDPFLVQDKAYVRNDDDDVSELPCWWIGEVTDTNPRQQRVAVRREGEGGMGRWCDALGDVLLLERNGFRAAGLGGPLTYESVALKRLYCGEEERFANMRKRRGSRPSKEDLCKIWGKGTGKGGRGGSNGWYRSGPEFPWGEIPGAKWERDGEGGWTYGKENKWHFEFDGQWKEELGTNGMWKWHFDR
eukprot:g18563.t1